MSFVISWFIIGMIQTLGLIMESDDDLKEIITVAPLLFISVVFWPFLISDGEEDDNDGLDLDDIGYVYFHRSGIGLSSN